MSEFEAKILVVTDDKWFGLDLLNTVNEEHNVQIVSPEEDVIQVLNTQPVATIVLDTTGTAKRSFQSLALFEIAKKSIPQIPIIAISNGLDHITKLEFADLGIYGFIEKPVKPEDLQVLLRQSVGLWRLRRERSAVPADFDHRVGFARILGASLAIKRVIKIAYVVAKTDVTVLLTGENGTGKEIFARAIHEESARRNAPFVAVSCAALPETLIESELFGHEKGAFTSANAARKGRFELADGGTLFLDEIGELPPSVQLKLLRVLQEREFERLGGVKTLPVDIRLIAASNRDLEHEVKAGHFRQDLFFRLNVVPVTLPPLRERHEDIPLLAAHFAAKAAQRHGRATPMLDPTLLSLLAEYDWPGNVRELENLIERLVVLSTGPRLMAEDLPERMLDRQNIGGYQEKLFDAIESFRTRRVREALEAEGGDTAAAAKRLGISRAYLYRLLKTEEGSKHSGGGAGDAKRVLPGSDDEPNILPFNSI